MQSWERQIIFEGAALPGVAIAIDHLALYGNLPEMPEATAEWLWQFTICNGRRREDRSEAVLRHVSEALELVLRFRARLIETVPKRYDASFTPEVLELWACTLQMIAEIARTREVCIWEAPLRTLDHGDGQAPGRSI